MRLVEHVGDVGLELRDESQVLEQPYQRSILAEGDGPRERPFDGVACSQQLVLGHRHQADRREEQHAYPFDVAA